MTTASQIIAKSKELDAILEKVYDGFEYGTEPFGQSDVVREAEDRAGEGTTRFTDRNSDVHSEHRARVKEAKRRAYIERQKKDESLLDRGMNNRMIQNQQALDARAEAERKQRWGDQISRGELDLDQEHNWAKNDLDDEVAVGNKNLKTTEHEHLQDRVLIPKHASNLLGLNKHLPEDIENDANEENARNQFARRRRAAGPEGFPGDDYYDNRDAEDYEDSGQGDLDRIKRVDENAEDIGSSTSLLPNYSNQKERAMGPFRTVTPQTHGAFKPVNPGFVGRPGDRRQPKPQLAQQIQAHKQQVKSTMNPTMKAQLDNLLMKKSISQMDYCNELVELMKGEFPILQERTKKYATSIEDPGEMAEPASRKQLFNQIGSMPVKAKTAFGNSESVGVADKHSEARRGGVARRMGGGVDQYNNDVQHGVHRATLAQNKLRLDKALLDKSISQMEYSNQLIELMKDARPQYGQGREPALSLSEESKLPYHPVSNPGGKNNELRNGIIRGRKNQKVPDASEETKKKLAGFANKP